MKMEIRKDDKNLELENLLSLPVIETIEADTEWQCFKDAESKGYAGEDFHWWIVPEEGESDE